MIDKLKDSYLFMTCAREALSIYMESAPIEEARKIMVSNYFLNEATDYEILYILVESDFPERTYDSKDEERCLNHINMFLENNRNIFDLNNVKFEEIYSLREWNMSSQPSVAKFILDNHLITNSQRKLKDREVLKENILDNKESSLSELIMLSALLYASYKAYKARLDRLYKRCTKLKGKERTECIMRAKISSHKTHLSRLRSSYPMCRGTRNPNRCRTSIKKKMSRIVSKIEALEKKLEGNNVKPEPKEAPSIYRRKR
jgi:hypothetical protein